MLNYFNNPRIQNQDAEKSFFMAMLQGNSFGVKLRGFENYQSILNFHF